MRRLRGGKRSSSSSSASSSSVAVAKKARMSRAKGVGRKLAQREVEVEVVSIKGEEENTGCAVNKVRGREGIQALGCGNAEVKRIFVAAQSLVDLSHHYSYILEKLQLEKEKEEVEESGDLGALEADEEEPQQVGKEEEREEDRGFLNSEPYRKRAQELLFSRTDILVGERKDAFFELVRQLCPYIDIVRSGSKTLRTYLVDTRKKKRYRTYSDAIKGGALDPLIIETGTVVLLKGCVEEAKRRYDMIVHKA